MTDKTEYKKKLIEVAMPLDVINRASSSEKSVRHGHPSTIHLWWSRKPLAACRAVLFATLVDDPGNSLPEKEAEKERERLFKIIGKIVSWENTSNVTVFKEALREIEKSIGKSSPIIFDPFCGGGSIPLEAQRLGLRAWGSDLNPVAVLISKGLTEIPSRFDGVAAVNPAALSKDFRGQYKGGEGLAADVEYYGQCMLSEAKKMIGHLYPNVDNKEVIAWIWARTVRCPNPACGIETPLVRSFKLLEKGGKNIWVDSKLDWKSKNVNFVIKTGDGKIKPGTIGRKGARCVSCGEPFKFNYIREEGKAGRISQQLMAIVLETNSGQSIIAPIEKHIQIAKSAKPEFIPDEELPHNTRDFKTPLYGMTKFSDLFTFRQLVALTTFSDLVMKIWEQIHNDAIKAGLPDDNKSFEDGGKGAKAYADAISTYLAFAVDRCADYWSNLTRWEGGFIGHTFQRQALPMGWDFAEANPFSNSTGSWSGAVEWISLCLKISACGRTPAKIVQLDASSAFPQEIKAVICTDPPYYNNISYADLSDFFYIWLRRSIAQIYPVLFSTLMVPKNAELVASPYRFEGNQEEADRHFLEGLAKSFHLCLQNSLPDFPITIFYAFKESEQDSEDEDDPQYASTGWEKMLEGLIRAGFKINGTWPMRTERQSRRLAIGTNALASSIVLVCRPRSADAPLATRREFISNLKKELPRALAKLQYSNIAPVDLAQSAIGPGMEVFSRYSKVIEADGRQMNVRTALQIINQELDTYLNTQENDVDQETRFCLSWFEQYGMNEGPFGQADILAKAKNTNVERLANAHLVNSRGGKVRLLQRSELPNRLDLSKLARLSVWLCTQELIKHLEQSGEDGAAKLILKIGAGQAETAKDLAYSIYSLCQKKGWADEALAYNNLVVSWPAIQQKAGLGSVPEGQMRL